MITIEFANGLSMSCACGNLFNREFEGVFEIINTPSMGTGWIPEFPLDDKYLYIPPVEYVAVATCSILTAKSKDWDRIASLQDTLRANISSSIKKDMDKLVSMVCRMGGYLDTALMWIPNNAIELWADPNERERHIVWTMRATVGMIVI